MKRFLAVVATSAALVAPATAAGFQAYAVSVVPKDVVELTRFR
jgi:hypothetical protein